MMDIDPQHPTDLLGRPITDGDMIAWATTAGRSPALCIGRIERINFKRKVGYTPKKCDRSVAESYTITIQPIKSTGYLDQTQYVPKGFIDTDGVQRFHRKLPQPKLKTLQLVKNIVKLEQV